MPDRSKQGTGAELGRIDFGPKIGTVIVRDDGDPDNWIRFWDADEPTRRLSFTDIIAEARTNLGDDVVVEELGKLVFDPEPTEPEPGPIPMPRYTGGPIICHDCGLTWPRKRNQTPDPDSPDTCPNCYDDTEEPEP